MSLTVGTLARAAKRCALNPSISDVEFLNAFYAPYVLAGKIEKRGSVGFPYEFDRHRASRVLNGEVDVPACFRKVWLQHGLEKRVQRECDVLFDETVDPGLFEFAKQEILDLIDGEDTRSIQLRERLIGAIDEPSRFLACAMIGSMGYDNRRNPETIILKKDSGELCWKVADLLNYGFHNRKRSRNLIVIPVNCEFDTHVTRAYENVEKQHVSERTIQGQWLTRMQQSGTPEAEISRRIQESLGSMDASCPVGTIVTIDTEKAAYVLLAISSFDRNNVARSDAADIERALYALLEFYEQKGQGADMYLPLVGSGLSKSGLNQKGSFALIEKVVGGSPYYLGGKLTIVMRRDDMECVGL